MKRIYINHDGYYELKLFNIPDVSFLLLYISNNTSFLFILLVIFI